MEPLQTERPRLILIRAAGSAGIGYGHLARTAALFRELLRRNAGEVRLEWEAPRQEWGTIRTLFDVPAGLVERHPEIEPKSAEKKHFTILVTDLLGLERTYFEAARDSGIDFCVHINDSGDGRHAADAIIDCDVFKDPTFYPDYSGELLLGASYKILSEKIVSLRLPDRPLVNESTPCSLLLSCGASDPDAITEKFLDAWIESDLSCTTPLTCVIGAAFEADRKSHLHTRQADSDINLKFVEGSDGLHKTIPGHSFVISLGGITNYEAACLGICSLTLETDRLSYWVSRIAATGMTGNLGQVSEAIRRLEELLPRRADIARKGWELCDGQGAKRVAAFLTSRAKSQLP